MIWATRILTVNSQYCCLISATTGAYLNVNYEDDDKSVYVYFPVKLITCSQYQKMKKINYLHS